MAQKIFNFLVFVFVIIGVMYYADYEDSTKVTKEEAKTITKEIVNNEEAKTITQEIVITQGPLILKDLGVGDDGILSRITISEGVTSDDYAGLYQYRTMYTNNNSITYDQGTNSINLYPFIYLIERDDKGNPIFLQADQYPSKDEFRKEMIETLAHELRHYWQDQTGESIKHPYDTSIPHDERWAEKDANDYMEKYFQSIQDK
jgi:hypothetical protein